MKMLVLAVLAVIAFLGGAIGGEALRRKPVEASAESTAPVSNHGDDDAGSEIPDGEAAGDDAGHAEADAVPHGESDPDHAAGAGEDWFRFPNQFFVPVMRNGTTSAVMVLSLTIEMPSTSAPRIAAQEHRLRDALLNALMIEANTGGFDGNFTSETSLSRLRKSLLAAARKAGGSEIGSVLIEDIARQEQ